MVDLNFSQGTALRVSAGYGSATLSLTPGAGVHRLAVTVTISSVGLEAALPIQLCGELYAELPNASRWLGPLHVKPVVTRAFECSEQLTCSLSDSQLWAIEALRGDRDLSLRLHLEGVLLSPLNGLHPVREAQERADVPAEVWARQLESLGAAAVVEVLVPVPLDGSALRRAVERVREAKGHITDGKYGEAISKARAALDHVREVAPSDSSARGTKPPDRTPAQRWSVLVDDLYSLASAANHDNAMTDGFTWSREDAVMVVSAAAGLPGRLSRP